MAKYYPQNYCRYLTRELAVELVGEELVAAVASENREATERRMPDHESDLEEFTADIWGHDVSGNEILLEIIYYPKKNDLELYRDNLSNLDWAGCVWAYVVRECEV